jgi:hypothetical protein
LALFLPVYKALADSVKNRVLDCLLEKSLNHVQVKLKIQMTQLFLKQRIEVGNTENSRRDID